MTSGQDIHILGGQWFSFVFMVILVDFELILSMAQLQELQTHPRKSLSHLSLSSHISKQIKKTLNNSRRLASPFRRPHQKLFKERLLLVYFALCQVGKT